MSNFVSLANSTAKKLGISSTANNNLTSFGPAIQNIIDATISQGKASIEDIEKGYNEEILKI